ncbi:MAG: epimerase [Deltaproteobacteria bacterium]|nr:epimerase [Deltaproteobacteria bacterium]
MIPAKIAFLTGFPGFLAMRMIRRLLADPRYAQVLMLVDELQARELEELIASLPLEDGARIVPFYGKEGCMDLGLAGSEVQRLTEEVTSFWHLSAADWPDMEAALEAQPLVEGVRELLAIAREARRLERLCYFSSAFVSGRRQGVILEEELEMGQRFRSPCEEVRYRAELEVAQAVEELPITIFRPTIVVGDSRTGELDRLGVTCSVVDSLVHGLREATSLPGGGEWPLHLVPVDFVIEAAFTIAHLPEGARRTFHLADPNPLPTRRVVELVTHQLQRRGQSRSLTARLARTLGELPWMQGRAVGPRNLLEYFDQPVYYRTANLLAILNNMPLRCPPFEDYAEVLVEHVRSAREERSQAPRQQTRPGWDPMPRHRLPTK